MSANYTEDELNLLASTPQLIGSAMAFIGNSELFGTGKEMFANAQSVMAGVKDYPNNALIQSILPNPQGDSAAAMEKMKKVRDWGVARLKAKGIKSAEEFRDAAMADVQAAADLLAAKSSPQEAEEYRQWCMSIAEKVAMATTEGGFLGFGGERLSANEKQLLSQFEGVLGVKSTLA
ncbi:MAG: hypothetical protein FJ190_07070 [Gammaproteobacteria bacterium]|nr:hypothetical protein [Gammaproteobacteria bacterium]